MCLVCVCFVAFYVVRNLIYSTQQANLAPKKCVYKIGFSVRFARTFKAAHDAYFSLFFSLFILAYLF